MLYNYVGVDAVSYIIVDSLFVRTVDAHLPVAILVDFTNDLIQLLVSQSFTQRRQ